MDIEDRFSVKLPASLREDIFRAGTVRWFAALVMQAAQETESRLVQGSPRSSPVMAAPLAEWTQFVEEPVTLDGGPLYEPIRGTSDGCKVLRRRTDGMLCIEVPSRQTGGAGAFLLDREPVSAGAYARFLTAISPVPEQILEEWVLLPNADGRGVHIPIERHGEKWLAKAGCTQLPMWLVSWYGANAYSLWAHRHDWRTYRESSSITLEQPEPSAPSAVDANLKASFLVSEAEWERAARGDDQRTWPWGNDEPTEARACLAQHRRGQRYAAAGDIPAAPVHQRLGVGPYGHHHLSGNVWNWCRDAFEPIPDKPDRPLHGTTARWRTEKGGSWLSPTELGQISFRRGRSPAVRGRCLGFRCSHREAI